MLLITGSTGKLGHAIVKQIQKKIGTKEVVLMTTDLTKAQRYIQDGFEVRQGNFDDPDSLTKAFEGIDKLLIISTMSQDRFFQQKTAIDVAKKMGVAHVIYTSLAIQDIETSHVKPIMESHFFTEQYLMESGLVYTILRNTMYADAILDIVGDITQLETLSLPGGNGRVPYALRQEMGEGIANLLVENSHANKLYNIVGDNLYSYYDIAKLLGEIRQTTINYQDISMDIYMNQLKIKGIPSFMIDFTTNTVLDIRDKQYEIEDKTLSSLLGRPTKDLLQLLTTLMTV
ncbi:NmrA family NAD(P)-binding protein [Enterococcus wangshanyuanii]|uniref:NAD(P)-dependent oxidoreductase n=1 Tax=Enterococcus wangshanyuanii TaxID=2005703 RepID=A0ABQ1PUU7_9ENTE|nr:NmrA family NAD(P)-binding protein [Enterococcus wangshanyuanii]GGD04554.1 NAD(P)-dependent oxidoreductase [Enterococcus wangshanyuanii]